MPRGRVRKVARTPQKLTQHTLDGFVGSSSPLGPRRAATTPSKPRKAAQKQARVTISRDSSISDARASGSESTDVAAIHFEPEDQDSDEDRQPRPSMSTKKKVRHARSGSEEMEEVEDVASSQDEETVESPVAWKGKRKGTKRKQVLDDSEEEEVHPKMRKLVRGIRPPSPDEEEADILDEVDEERILESRFRTRNKKSTFQRNLERLKRKKRGESNRSECSSSASGNEEEEEHVAPFAFAQPETLHPSHDDSGHASDDDNFILEDDTTTALELPAEFSMDTHQDLTHQFKIICQLFVHVAVHKARDRRAAMKQLLENAYFSVPLQIARRKITGMRDSLVTSSVWRLEFKKPLEAYPEFATVRLDFAIPTCDACHLGGRMSTLLGRLSGMPYDKLSFEPLPVNISSDSDSSEDEEDNTKKEFHLGRFCAARTHVFHKFTHWEYATFKALLQEVDELRGNDRSDGFVRVAYAGGVKPPEDLSDADGIMDWLDERGVINMEWQRIKEMMEGARQLDMRAKKGEEDAE
ncbi:hypothetical protein BKA93DRAFT_821589 [Sparassis latifolia]|uniref:DUF4211 domain-containing protein n=1 Tax=Sparassis crispa TaxID=139825 RepID=A0A401GII6_9APHY|nr:hypothetical protein SCP_0403440 [Sparassis crispa]GBE81968.1 hypothetical protein SCP_0403440 [Sparassis crispa]